jgi:hypothetical protein
MFGQVLDKLDAWVGRSFLLASFFPFLIFIGANALMARFMTPEALGYLVSYFPGGASGPIGAVAVGLASAAAFAYLTDPLVAVTTKFIEGAYFPSPIGGWLATDETKKARDLSDEEQRLAKMRNDLYRFKQTKSAEMQAAKNSGVAIGAILEPMRILEAEDEIGRLNERQNRQQLIPVADLERAAAALRLALMKNCADLECLAAGAPEHERRRSIQLFGLFRSWTRLVDYAHTKATSEHSLAVYEKQSGFAPIQASTEFGNHAAALRSFFETRFKFDFDFLWPIVQLVAQNDQKMMDALINAKQKLDFCTRILLYTVVFTATWLVVAAATSKEEWTVLVLGTAGFILIVFWLEIIEANYRSVSELIRSIVILKRFDVLKALHQRLPETWAEEKKLWGEITLQLLWGSDAEIKYQHSDK